jgi:tRNA (guanine37-N1)-methyltransferase
MAAPLRFDVFTLFPEVFLPYLEASILQRARENHLVDICLHNIRDWATDRHHVCDDMPYGGGGGMVMKPEPIFSAVETILGTSPACPVILLSPQGRVFTQALAQELAQQSHLAFCAAAEGADDALGTPDRRDFRHYVLSGVSHLP